MCLIIYVIIAMIGFIFSMKIINMELDNKEDYLVLIALTIGEAFLLVPVVIEIEKIFGV